MIWFTLSAPLRSSGRNYRTDLSFNFGSSEIMLPIQALCQLVIGSRTTLCCGSQPFFLAKSTGYFWGSFFLQLFLVLFFFLPAVPWKRQLRTSGDALGSGHMYDDVIILCFEDRPLSFHKKTGLETIFA